MSTPMFAAEPIDFDHQVAPILVSHCLECHQGATPEGGLNLTTSERFHQGGESGPSVVIGQAEESLLWERIRVDEMPPEHPLNDAEKQTIKQWLDEGANWGSQPLDLFSVSTDSRAGRDWWSLKSLHEVTVPLQESDWCRNAIDHFVLQRLRKDDLSPSPEATPRQLIRRLFFDLIGLPPSPEQVTSFEANPTEAAYQKMVDDLLGSQHYGERWGRHWLDVVRFGESDGFERNFQREHAWPYRDWVIQAFNDDLPYDEFVRMQFIGDQLTGGMEGAAATGFWVAGVHNTTVGGSDRMKQLARQDEIEDVLGTVGQAFMGLTFNCARCHDHKFDPISQKEYYQLVSAVSGLGFGEREFPIPEERQKLDAIDQELHQLKLQRQSLDQSAREKLLASRRQGKPSDTNPLIAFARWEFDHDLRDSVGQLDGQAHGNARLEGGALVLDGRSFVQTNTLPSDLREKTLEAWIQLDTLEQRGGAALSVTDRQGGAFDAIVFGEQEPFRWMAGSDRFTRTQPFGGPDETEAVSRPIHVAMVYRHDGTIEAYRDGLPYGKPVRKADLQPFVAEESEVLFGLRHKPAGGNRYLTGKVHRAALYDRSLTAEEVAAAASTSTEFVSEAAIIASLNPEQKALRVKLQKQLTELRKARDEQVIRSKRKIYTFISQPVQETHVLLRGDPDNVGEAVQPGATAAIEGLSADFGLASNAPESQRRRGLGDWIASRKNPLLARVIANRIWHHHFGAGIVNTPNDFGFNGGRPSHPELLEYLATKLRRDDYRLKNLHRLIVSSSTYRQASRDLPWEHWRAGKQTDVSNRLLWRSNFRRLDAESLRDAMLSVAGQLNPAMGGPSFQDVSITLNNGTTYYEPMEVDGPEYFRRTVYRFNPRGGRSALLDTFDCPDPASTAPKRSVTTTPLQSLSLMNNFLVMRLADYFAKRVQQECTANVDRQISRAWQLAIARKPDESERTLSQQLVTQHGLTALCRGLFNLNEFVVIE